MAAVRVKRLLNVGVLADFTISGENQSSSVNDKVFLPIVLCQLMVKWKKQQVRYFQYLFSILAYK